MTQEQQALAVCNHNLIYHVIRRICGGNAVFDDWYGVAAIGLCNAARTYEAGKGANFATYAYRCIQNEILKERVKMARRSPVINAVSLNAETSCEGVAYIDVIQGDSSYPLLVELTSLLTGGGILTAREQQVVCLYAKGCRVVEIAKALGYSQPRISSILKVARVKIKKYMEG